LWSSALVLLLSLSLLGFHGGDTRQSQATPDQGDRLVDVIISFSDAPRQDQVSYIRGLGARVSHEYRYIPAISATVPESLLTAVRRYSNVVRVEADGKVQALETGPGALAQTVPWGIVKVKAPEVHPFDQGLGVKVAVIDTGIDLEHQDVTVAGGVSFVSGVASPDDDNGHGTHVAGSIAAVNNTIGVLGVAPQASLYAVKVLNKDGSGSWSSVIAGIDWSISNGMQIVSMSLGASTAPSAMQTAVLAAYSAGIVLVAAAGNAGNSFAVGSNVAYPAKFQEVIAVAAVDETDARASFSSTGSEVELSAPGVNVLSTTLNNTYSSFSGTSMATPHVSGLAALLLASGTVPDEDGNGTVNNKDVRLRMQKTAVDLGSIGRDPLYGYGLINAQAAVIPGVSNKPPVADAGGPYTGIQGVAVAFNGAGSSDPDGDPLTYQWSFGDGSTGSGVSPTHAYASGGVFTVTLTVNDGKGGTDSDTTTATIEATNQLPVANAGPDKTVPLGSAVTLDGSGSSDPDGAIASFQWSFGDGSTATGATVSHTYAAAGVYTATLTVTDNKGATAQDAAMVTVAALASSKIHVADVSAVIKDQFRGWKTWAEVSVKVVDAAGSPVAGVTVSGQWSNATTSAASATTDASGVARFASEVLRRPPAGTTFTFTVTNLQKSGYEYDAASDVEKSASATV
jgi:subtilisin family serine protease